MVHNISKDTNFGQHIRLLLRCKKHELNELLHILSNYVQIVSNSARLSKSLLNHIYILKKFLSETDAVGYIIDVHFNDHDVVKCIFNGRNK